jgi:two-component system, OmpR family, sensor histidine kinase KdpD
MVGLMGAPPWFRPDDEHGGLLARLGAKVLAPFRGRHALTWFSLGAFDRWPANLKTPRRYFSATVLVTVAVGVSWLLQPFLVVGSLVLPFLITIMLTATAYGLLPSLLASALSVLAFDFFFLPPLYSLNVSEPDDIMRLVVFATAALIVSNLAAYARAQAVTASRRAEVAEDLYRFGRQLAGAATLREVLDASLPRLTALLRAPVLIALPDDGNVVVYPAAASGEVAGTEFAFVNSGDNSCIKSCVKSWLQTESVSGTDNPMPVSPHWLLVPMRTGLRKVGVMAVAHEALDTLQVPNSDALFGTLADLVAQAIHRINLADDLTLATRAAEREQLHAALLASLSHDLRTPLAAVLAAAESLVDYRPMPGGEIPGEDSPQVLARSIRGEARRLDRYIGDLLDMARLESGLADATANRIDLTDALSVALDRCAANLSRHDVTVDVENDLPLLAGDEVLLEHVIFNLLDNAAKYTPPDTLIQLRASRQQDRVAIEIIDEGGGIRPADLERVFDKFFRGKRQGPQSQGIGLGLAICRGYIEAMGGRITARNRVDRAGAVFTIVLPIPETEDLPDLDA